MPNRSKHIGTIFLFFVSFHCPQLFYCLPCPTLGPASLIQTDTIETRAGGDVGENGVTKAVVSDLPNDVAAWPEVIVHNVRVDLVKAWPGSI